MALLPDQRDTHLHFLRFIEESYICEPYLVFHEAAQPNIPTNLDRQL